VATTAGGTNNGGGFAKAISGTIDTFNASTNTLTIKGADGATQTFTISKARIVKSQKITSQQFSTLLGTSNAIVQMTGQPGGSDTYTAQTLVVSDISNMGGNGTAPRGTPSTRPKGTPSARPNGTPRAGTGAGGARRITLRNGKLQNNQLIGTDQSGKTITVKLDTTTVLFQQTAGTTGDLKAGITISVMAAPSQGSTSQDARSIVIGDLEQPAAN